MTVALTIRLPEELHAHVKERAEASNRSLNAQIVTELERYIDPDGYVRMPVEWAERTLSGPAASMKEEK